jgi:hypothetical protein
MKPTLEQIEYACSVERYSPKTKFADAFVKLVLCAAFVVVLLDVFVWRR